MNRGSFSLYISLQIYANVNVKTKEEEEEEEEEGGKYIVKVTQPRIVETLKKTWPYNAKALYIYILHIALPDHDLF